MGVNVNLKLFMILLAACALASGAGAAASSTDAPSAAAPDAASPVISPGRYMTSVMPPLDHDMSARVEKALKNFPGLEAVQARADDSSIHFTVKANAQVRAAQIQKAVEKIDAGAVTTTPILEHSLTVAPGL